MENSDFMDRLLLAQTTVDLDTARRGEEGLIERLLADGRTRAMLVNHGLVAVPKRTAGAAPGALASADDPGAPRPDAAAPTGPLALALLPAEAVRDGARCPGCLAIYLGLDRSDGTPFIALDITRAAPAGGAPAGARMHVDGDLGAPAHTPFAEAALSDFDWVELRSFAPCASARDAGLATNAVAVSAWHAGQRFCPVCGEPVAPALAGWAQVCTGASDGRLLFPRIEPAVITAITDDEDRILLQNNAAWRRGFFSVSAGFVEAGESLEHAVRREAAEEVGVELGAVSYLGSQPWPFPSSLMLGFTARALTTEVAVDGDEVASARWFTRDELARAVSEGRVELPGRASIARHLIEHWYGSPLGA